ncbi:MAG: potassium channel family protein [Amaricoccus sp.]
MSDPLPERLTLRRASRRPGWVALILRLLLVFALIGVALAVHWLDRGGLHDNTGEPLTFLDVLYFTMITVTTVGYGDIVPVTQRARLFDTVLVTPIRIFIWLIFLGTAYQFLLRNVWEGWRMSRIQGQLRDHVIVAGFGTSGNEAVCELLRRGIPSERIVVVDTDPAALEQAAAHGVAVLQGDATRNATLAAVKVERAKCIAVAAGRDDTTILIVLTAHGMAPGVPISAVIRADDNEDLARQAGATTVINPASFAGLLLAGSAQGPHLAEYMTDLAAASGRVALKERQVTPAEVGRPLAAIGTGLGVRVYRGGKVFGFWEPESGALQAGDTILEIVPRGEPRPA